ncbi:MAG: glucokinase [Mariniblastus sp.]|jgi:glucokinase
MTTSTQFSQPLFAGIDVGGTNIKIGLVDDRGQIIADTKFPTSPDESPAIAIEQTRVELMQLIEPTEFNWEDVAAVGLGTPGPMDIQEGIILTPTNLKGWHNYPIQSELSSALGKPVTYANDAGAAAFGEYWVGGGQEYESMVLLTLGTGVGGGIIVNDFSIDGANSHGAEIGHMTIETGPNARICGCGHRGHLEAYASATSLVKRTSEAMANPKNGSSTILRKQTDEASPLSALMISNAAAGGDALANQMVSETAVYLGRGIAQLAHIIDPAAFILGGAMNFGGCQSSLGRKFLDEVMQETRRHVFPVLGERLVVSFAQLGSEAGFVGAAGLARIKLNQEKTAASASE